MDFSKKKPTIRRGITSEKAGESPLALSRSRSKGKNVTSHKWAGHPLPALIFIKRKS
jgi:hypothetical protein